MAVLKWTAKDSDKYSKIYNSYVQLSGTPRFSNPVLQTTRRGFSWSRGTQLLDSAAINERKPLPCFYLLFFQKNQWNDNLWACGASSSQMKVDREVIENSVQKNNSLCRRGHAF